MNELLCDIIVPIYNAYDDVVECVESIIKNTNDNKYRLILIDDKSTDNRVQQYLNKFQFPNMSNVIIINNDVNLGFVKTVNKGIKYSNNDVVLLNSDTIVTKGWLKKIQDCAYRDDRIATVTPLTNSGSLCSIPKMGEYNDIPKWFNVEEYADMIEKISFKKYPPIPVGVGFCMFIKRKALNEIGILDEEAFNKGYGEEIDFCLRSVELGFINVLCDDTFIYHKGAMSFKDLKKIYVEENTKILQNRYPYYLSMMSKFAKKNPLKDIQKNIELYSKIYNKKRNILYLLSDSNYRDSYDYKDNYQLNKLLELIKDINEFNKFVLISNGNELFLNVFIENEIIKFRFDIEEDITYTTFYSNRYRKIIKEIIAAFEIDIVHIYHLKNHTFDLIELASEVDIPKIITINDYYIICPVLYNEDILCEKVKSKETCLECIKSKIGYNMKFLETWNKMMKQVISKMDNIYVISENLKKIIKDYYKDVNLNIKVLKKENYQIFKEEYNKLVDLSEDKDYKKIVTFDLLLIYNSYKRYIEYEPYRELCLSILNEIDEKEWKRCLEKISKKVELDEELLAYMKLHLCYIRSKFRNEKLDYVIWGASNSGKVTKAVIEEIMPSFRLVGYIDKFKEGYVEGIPIYKPEDLDKIKFDYAIISTSAGKEEAKETLNIRSLCKLSNYMYGYGVI